MSDIKLTKPMEHALLVALNSPFGARGSGIHRKTWRKLAALGFIKFTINGPVATDAAYEWRRTEPANREAGKEGE